MPHIIVEHSKGVTKSQSIPDLLRELHNVAVLNPTLPTGGIRTRAHEAEQYLVGDGKLAGEFIYITVRLGQGRSLDVKQEIGASLFKVLTDFTQAYLDAGHPLSLGLEIQEIEKDWTWKKNNIHAIIKDKAND